MSIKIQVRADRRAYPLIVCDHCGTQIEKAADGNAFWLAGRTALQLRCGSRPRPLLGRLRARPSAGHTGYLDMVALCDEVLGISTDEPANL